MSILERDTVSFGQPLVPSILERAMRVSEEADCLVAVGTSLEVYPIAAVLPSARSAGAAIVIVNAQSTPFDQIADPRLTGSISDLLPALVDEHHS